jgi:Ca-activated chloride channel family protein
VPLLVALTVLLRRRRARYAVSYTNLQLLQSVVKEKRPSWTRRVPLILLVGSLALAAAALARPRVALSSTSRSTTIMLVVDVSASMQATDVPPSRLGAAVAAMQAFLVKLPASTEVGLVTVGDEGEVVDPPTTNHTLIASGLDVLTPHGGTAVGEGIDAAVRTITAVDAAAGIFAVPGTYLPAAIVIATDGGQDRGTIGVQASANVAKAQGIRIYGVTVGTADGVISRGPGLIRDEYPVPVDPGTVALLARVTGGQAYNAASASSLDTVYRTLGTKVATHFASTEITSWFEIAAAALLLAGAGALRFQASALL